MKKKCKLTLEERTKIYSMTKFGMSPSEIGRQVKRHRSTIIRELKRNNYKPHGKQSYYDAALAAHTSFLEKRKIASSRIRLKSKEIQDYVELHLVAAGWSPEIIAGRLRRLGYQTNYESIYQWINKERTNLKCYLKVAGKSRRRRRAVKRRKIKQGAAKKRSIETLPIESKLRLEIGHFELDAVEGEKGGSVLQNLTDRKSRRILIHKVNSMKSEDYSQITLKLLSNVPAEFRRTILQDNGGENAKHAEIDEELGTTSYFCHPYCSSEKGSVENRNKIIRQYVSKGTDWEYIPEDWIEFIQMRINNTPLKVLGFQTPEEVWQQEISQLAA